jgi:iron-sulfur cluster repair protein YtfE (RIC family)
MRRRVARDWKGTVMELIDAILRDHEQVRALFERVASATGKRREDAFDKLRAELIRHEVAEEQIVRPLTRRFVPNGKRTADARVKEEGEAEKVLKKMEKVEFASPQWERDFERLWNKVLQHAEKEETVEFPRLEEAVDPAELRRRGQMFQTAKKVAPTHPHPATPNTPLAHMTVGQVAALVDRARDAVTQVVSK